MKQFELKAWHIAVVLAALILFLNRFVPKG